MIPHVLFALVIKARSDLFALLLSSNTLILLISSFRSLAFPLIHRELTLLAGVSQQMVTVVEAM